MRAMLALALGTAVSLPASAVDPFPTVMIEGASRVDGEARWSFALWRAGIDACRSPPRAGDEDFKGWRSGAVCVRSTVVVKNDSTRPLQCKLAIEVPIAREQERRHAEALHVVLPGTETAGVSVMGEAAELPHSFSATCRIIPESFPANLDELKACELKLESPPSRDYYPWASMTRGDEGDTILEFALDPKTRKVVDPMVIASSGFADLDNAALDLSEGIRGKSKCPDHRFRLKVRFRLHESTGG